MSGPGGAFDAGDLVGRLRVEASGFEQGLQEAKTMAAEVGRDIAKSFGISQEGLIALEGGIGGVVTAIAAAETAAYAMAAASAEWAHELEDATYWTGLSTVALEKWRRACVDTGADVGTLQTNMLFLSRFLGKADSDTDPAISALHKMGIAAKDVNGQLRDMDDLMPEIIAGLGEVTNQQERAGLASQLFGRNTREVLKLAAESEQVAKSLKTASVHSPEEIARAAEYKIELDKIQAGFDRIWRDVGLQLIPAMKRDIIPAINTILELTRKIAPIIVDVINGFHILGMTVLSVGDLMVSVFTAFWKAMQGDFGGAYSTMTDSWSRVSTSFLDFRKQLQADQDQITADNLARNNAMSESLKDETGAVKNLGDEYDETSKKEQLSASQIRDINLEVDKMTKRTIPDQKDQLKALSLEYAGFSDKGSAAAKAVKGKIDDLNYAVQENYNKLDDWNEKLTGIATTISGMNVGGSSYNDLYKSSINTGGVGPDTAGFSEMAKMSQDELQKIVDKGWGKDAKTGVTGYLAGQSKATTDLAITYLSLMKNKTVEANKEVNASNTAAATTATATSNKAVAGSEAKGEAAKDAASTAVTAQTEENNKIKALYIEMEGFAAIHYTAMTEYLKIAVENMTKNWFDFVAALAANPAIANIGIVQWTKNGPDWNPTGNAEFMQTSRIAAMLASLPSYKSADFSSVQTLGTASKESSESSKETTKESTGSTLVIQTTVNNPVGVTTGESVRQASITQAKYIRNAGLSN